MRVGVLMLYGGTSCPFSPNFGTEMQLMSRIFSPTLVPPRRGSHVYTGASALPLLLLGPTTSAVPKYEAATDPAAAAPLKLGRIGMPLARDEMPDSCQPLSSPLATGLSIPPLATSGRNAFHDTFSTWVRSEPSTPYVRPGSYGSIAEYSPPSVPRLRLSV